MRDSIYRFTLDVHDVASQVQIVAKKNDNARKIYVNLMENGKPYPVEEGCQAVIMIKKPDDNILLNDCYLVNSGSVIAYDFTEQTTSMEGLCECELRVFDAENELITSPRFTILVNENVYEDGQVESTSEFTTLADALSDIAEIREGIKDVNRAKADVELIKEETEEIRNDAGNIRNETGVIKIETEQIKTDVEGLKNTAVQASLDAEASKQYIIDHREELMGEAGVIYKTEEPTDPAERVGIWINPDAPFVPIPVGESGGGADIDDTDISPYKTWSSQKIDGELNSVKSEFVTPTEMETYVTEKLAEIPFAEGSEF